MNNGPPAMLFFSGLGADSNLFAFQKQAFPQLVAPNWIVPEKSESLDEYLDRLLDGLEQEGRIDRSQKIVVGGASFGGLVAQNAARKLDSGHCILFGSIKHAEEAPRRVRWLWPLHFLAFRWIICFWQLMVRLFVWVFGRLISRRAQSILTQFSQLDSRLIQWSIRQLYLWLGRSKSAKNSAERQTSSFKIHQIHGRYDRVFPSSLIKDRDDTNVHILENAGHLLTLFESAEVNRIIDQIVEQS